MCSQLPLKTVHIYPSTKYFWGKWEQQKQSKFSEFKPLQLSKKHGKTYILPCNLSTSTRFAILHKKNFQAVIHRISDHRFFSYAFLFSIFFTLPVQSTCWYFKQSIINSQKIRISNEFGHKSFGFDMVEVIHNYPCSHLPNLTLHVIT